MAAASLGNRLLCGACGARYYDLNRAEPFCPKCKTVWTEPKAVRRARPKAEPVPEPETVDIDADEEEDDDGVEEVNLDTDRILPSVTGADDDDDETGDPALDELEDAELPDEPLTGFGNDDDDDDL